MLSFFLTKVLCYVVGISIPGYGSFRALETFDPNDEKQWLTYWVVYALMETVDTFAYPILIWIPLYYELKLMLILWLMLPGTRGAEVLYDNFIWAFLHKYASQYDPTFKSDYEGAHPAMDRAIFQEAKKVMNKKGPSVLDDLAEQVHSIANSLQGKSK